MFAFVQSCKFGQEKWKWVRNMYDYKMDAVLGQQAYMPTLSVLTIKSKTRINSYVFYRSKLNDCIAVAWSSLMES